MVFDIKLPFAGVRISAVTELFSADPKQANSGIDPARTVPKSIACGGGIYSGKMTVTSKPISVVRIDFEAVD